MKQYVAIVFLSLLIATSVRADSDPRAAYSFSSATSSAEATYLDIEDTLGLVPQFLKLYPTEAISGAWRELKLIQLNPQTALTGRDKELIGLGVAAQIPCSYCSYFHTGAAKLNGATDAQAREAIAMAAATRHWSTFVNGISIDKALFKRDLALVVKHVKKQQAAAANKPQTTSENSSKSVVITTPEDAYADIRATLGVLPEFLQKFPKVGIVAAWQNMKSLELNPATLLSVKLKQLIGLAVAAQIPCEYCIAFHTESAKLEGATDEEIAEAVAMASITRQWSTVLNGNQVDQDSFIDEADDIFGYLEKKQKESKKS